MKYIAIAILCGLCASHSLTAASGERREANDEYIPLISEDKVWEYVSEYTYNGKNFHELNRYEFSGSAEKNGRQYNILFHTGSTSWRESPDPDGTVSISDYNRTHDRVLEAYMREENGKVYVIPQKNALGGTTEFNPEGDTFSDKFNRLAVYDEVLLYDFSISGQAESMCQVRWEPDGLFETIIAPVSCFSSEEEVHGDKILRAIRLINPVTNFIHEYYYGEPIGIDSDNIGTYGIVWLQGVGSVGHGVLDAPGGYTGLPESEGYGNTEMFNNLYDKEGNVLYQGKNITDPLLGGMIEAVENCNRKHAVYDLHGNRVDCPQPGSVYIRDGRKFVPTR